MKPIVPAAVRLLLAFAYTATWYSGRPPKYPSDKRQTTRNIEKKRYPSMTRTPVRKLTWFDGEPLNISQDDSRPVQNHVCIKSRCSIRMWGLLPIVCSRPAVTAASGTTRRLRRSAPVTTWTRGMFLPNSGVSRKWRIFLWPEPAQSYACIA